MWFGMDHKCPDVQFIFDALARSLEFFNTGKRAIVKPIDLVLASIVLCLGGSSLWNPLRTFEGR